MSVYGSISSFNWKTNLHESNQPILQEDFFTFIKLSDSYINEIFENLEFNSLSIEENVYMYISEGKEIKKSIIQKIKELFQKFAGFAKDIFNKLFEKLKALYNKNDFTDKVIFRYKDKVTWENIQVMIDKGWPGISTKYCMVGKPAKPDKFIIDELPFGPSVKYALDKIIEAKDISQAQDFYNDFLKKLDAFKEDNVDQNHIYNLNFIDTNAKMDIYKNVFNSEDSLKNIEQNLYFIVPENNKTEKYFPTKYPFESTKQFTENGQKMINKIKEDGNKLLKSLKIDEENAKLKSIESYQKHSNDVESYEDTEKINILYYKANYQYISTYLHHCGKMVTIIVKICMLQHKAAISFYMAMLKDLKKYLPEVFMNKK